MVYKNYLLILTSLIMFTFFGKVDAKYEKIFFDLSIKGINNETIKLSEFKGKTILLVNVASKCGFTMSLFVGNLAFVENIQYIDGVKIGVLAGSLLSTLFGYFILLFSSKS